jgi:hypothetical protein
MGVDASWLQGSSDEKPRESLQDVEALLKGFLKALVGEQGGTRNIADKAAFIDQIESLETIKNEIRGAV